LPSNGIQCLVPGRDGVIWVCTEGGLARLEVAGDEPRIRAVPGSGIENVRAACEDSSGSLWIGGDGPRVATQNNGQFTPHLLKGIPASASVRVLLCSGDTVWAGTSDGLIRVHGSEQHLYDVKDGLGDDFVFALAAGTSSTV